jgi:hypothetical protein
MRRIVVVAVLLLTGALSDCGGSSSTPSNSGTNPSSPTPTLPTGVTAADLAFCVQETNRYRAMVGDRSVTESAALEAYAADGARIDATAQTSHLHFTSTNGGGVAIAENEIPWWPLASFGTVQAVMQQGLAAMWAEGPSGIHYRNLVGPYTETGCGVYLANGEVTVAQDFR